MDSSQGGEAGPGDNKMTTVKVMTMRTAAAGDIYCAHCNPTLKEIVAQM